MFQHDFTDLGYDQLERVTSETGRYYVTPQGNRYPSITTILSHFPKKGLVDWEKRVGKEKAEGIKFQASNRGEKVHAAIEDYLWNKEPDLTNPWIADSFYQIKPHLDQNISKIFAIEKYIYSDILGIAGTSDFVGIWGGKKSIVDWKTSRKEKLEKYINDYFIQSTFYAIAWQELTGMVIDQIVIGICTDALTQPAIFKKDITKNLVAQTFETIKKYKKTETASKYDMGILFKGNV